MDTLAHSRAEDTFARIIGGGGMTEPSKPDLTFERKFGNHEHRIDRVSAESGEPPTPHQIEWERKELRNLVKIIHDGECYQINLQPGPDDLDLIETCSTLSEAEFVERAIKRIMKLYASACVSRALAQQERMSNCDKLDRERQTKRHWQGRAEAAESRIAELEQKIAHLVDLVDPSTDPHPAKCDKCSAILAAALKEKQ